MKKNTFIIIVFLFFAVIVLTSNTKLPVDTKSFVNKKWHVEDTSVIASMCFKSDNTLWNFYNCNSHLDSMFLCNWTIENNKIYLCNDRFNVLDLEIISCNDKCLIIKFIEKNEILKLHKIDN
jgi:hypothetical protein